MYLHFTSHGQKQNYTYQSTYAPQLGQQEDKIRHNQVIATLLYITTTERSQCTDDMLSEHFGEILGHSIASQGGIILEAQSDRIAALFVQNGQHNAANRAVTTAFELINETMVANRLRCGAEGSAVRLGVGLSTGSFSWQHAEDQSNRVPVPSDNLVESAKQLSDLNQQTPFPSVFITQETYTTLLPNHEWHIEDLGMIWLPGQNQAKAIHAVLPAMRT